MRAFGIRKKIRIAMGIAAVAASLYWLILVQMWSAFVLLLITLFTLYFLVKMTPSAEEELAFGGTPLWKRIGRQAGAAVLLLMTGGVLGLLAWGFSDIGHCLGCERGYRNSSARLACYNAATYIDQYEKLGGEPSDMDGTYWGSLQWEQGKDYTGWTRAGIDGSKESFDFAMKHLMGSKAERAGCYYVVIKSGCIVQAFWTDSDELLNYAPRYAERFGQGEVEGDFYIGGQFLGSYPTANQEAVTTPPEWLQLTFSDRMRTRMRHIQKYTPSYAIFIAPLLIDLIFGLSIKFAERTKKKLPLWKKPEAIK